MEAIVLIDGNNLAHRLHSVFGHLKNSKGVSTGGLYGLIRMLDFYSSKFGTRRIIMTWDSGTWREAVDEEYKAKRKKHSDAFYGSLFAMQEACRLAGMVTLMNSGYEADDLMALVVRAFKRNVTIVSNDKDLLQLVNDGKRVKVFRTLNKKGVLLTEQSVRTAFGVLPKEIPYLLALGGDSVDGIKGVPGYTLSKAAKFVHAVGNSKQILFALDPERGNIFMRNLQLIDLINTPLKLNAECLFSFRRSNTKALKRLIDDFEIKRYKAKHLTRFGSPEFSVEFIRRTIHGGDESD